MGTGLARAPVLHWRAMEDTGSSPARKKVGPTRQRRRPSSLQRASPLILQSSIASRCKATIFQRRKETKPSKGDEGFQVARIVTSKKDFNHSSLLHLERKNRRMNGSRRVLRWSRNRAIHTPTSEIQWWR